jgi:hypothetical protein
MATHPADKLELVPVLKRERLPLFDVSQLSVVTAAAAAAGAGGGTDSQNPEDWDPDELCDENQICFTVPERFKERGFHLRFKIKTNGKVMWEDRAAGGWCNPLTHTDGSAWSPAFFSPQLKAAWDKTGTKMPPPVLLGERWEQMHVVHTCGNREQHKRPRAGELRLYTLDGIGPSTELGWALSKIGFLGLGERKITIQVAHATRADGRTVAWEDAAWEQGDGMKLKHTMPTKGIVKYLFLHAVSWMRVGGVQEYQDFVDTHLSSKNRRKNLARLREMGDGIAQELHPLWTNQVGLYPIVTLQYRSTTLYQGSYHIQYLFF